MVANAGSTETHTASLKQLRANRRNARRSTGPKTPAGKAASSKNAVKHGFCSADVVVAGEDRVQFGRFRIEMLRWTFPRNELELEFAEQVIRSAWKLRRLQGAENTLYRDRARTLQQESPNQPADSGLVLGEMLWDDREFRGFQRYERQLNSIMHRAMEQLRKLRKDQPPGILPDFAGEEIEREKARLADEQNEANSVETDASDSSQESYDTNDVQMNTNGSDGNDLEAPNAHSEKPMEEESDGS